ncbi:MAG: hypothetical protein LVS60_04030 [Nodosilinea sp. LVE1205-7]|jgi:hypothetical protein
MISSYSSEPLGDRTSVLPSRHAPSVPISVYRELASELKANQALVDSLTQQNQRLEQQNHLLRQEILKFTESAFQLKQAIEPAVIPGLDPGLVATPSPAPLSPWLAPASLEVAPYARPSAKVDGPHGDARDTLINQGSEAVSHLTHQFSKILPGKPRPPLKKVAKPRVKGSSSLPSQASPILYTEERLEPPRVGQRSQKASDLSGLWLATTILLVVVSAFGAGFLVMKPLLHR